MNKTFLLLAATMMIGMFSFSVESKAETPSTFYIRIVNIVNDDDDDLIIETPHRVPAFNNEVYGEYDMSNETLCLWSFLDIVSIRIYKDNALLIDDSNPIQDEEGAAYYNFSFYGSGIYRICINDVEGNSHIAYLNI